MRYQHRRGGAKLDAFHETSRRSQHHHRWDRRFSHVHPKRDEIRMNRHRALGCCLSMIFSENRCALFRIML
ncbi:hypothetical protein EAS61_28105 [Bradyrhizobium zhanjiangense]|uniref:Uncharacterized protein n=1 Tax=Bradyrhizobium zhanjiangense TaxID=1325107 RepID=A0A4Q0QEK7_9BRAD|nr:hypothetical protein EAS61_28105 [Bradyrhizobium zhanjiangense]RXG90353.1 hypothetical protein EAS62_27940 [Bradyrhizobium zhanjiangense]